MLFLLRRIRRKLMQKNKFTTYLLYAFGEIVLVVAGILIALQINNWNEQRKLDKKEVKLLTELVMNLKTNEDFFLTNMAVEEDRINAINQLLGLIENFVPTDSLDVYFGKAMYREQLSISSASFDNLKNIGIDIIKDDSLKFQINQLFDVTYPMQKENTDLVSISIMNLQADFSFSNPLFFNNYRNGDFSDKDAVAKYQMILNAKRAWKSDVIKGHQRVLEETRSTMNQIEDYLKKIR